MKTWSPSSKKCSIADRILLDRVSGLSLAISLAIGLGLSSSSVWAQAASAVESALLKDLKNNSSGSFDILLSRWQVKYGTEAVTPLFKIAQSTKNEDPARYIAVMGAAKLGGVKTAPLIQKFLKDPSWMIRSAAIRALAALGDTEAAIAIIPLVRDPALVVRGEAVSALGRLKPKGAKEALIEALNEKTNFHAGKAQWVPQRALAALVDMDAKDSIPELVPLLKFKSDPALQQQTIRTLETLTGKQLKPEAELSEKILAWLQELGGPSSARP